MSKKKIWIKLRFDTEFSIFMGFGFNTKIKAGAILRVKEKRGNGLIESGVASLFRIN